MTQEILEEALEEARVVIHASDRDTEEWQRDVRVTKREFLSKVRELAEDWFDGNAEDGF